jgi:molybdate transport system substrate-binding protein
VAAPLRLLSTLGLMGILRVALPEAEIDAQWGPTAALLARIRAGARGEVALLTAEGIDALIAEGVLAAGSRVDLAVSTVGIAVAHGAPRPDLSTVESTVAALLAAPSLAYSKAGASGLFFAGLIQRLGIADAINAKAVVIPEGLTGERLLRGEVTLAIQQLSELQAVPGIDIVGPLPEAIGSRTIFSLGRFAGAAPGAEALAAQVAAICTPAVLLAAGLAPVG